MTRLNLVENATDTKTKELLDLTKAKLGLVPNMTRAMANSPAVLEGYLGLSGSLGGGALPARIREQIAILSAEVNGCAYCLSAHSAIGKMVGLAPSDIDAAREGGASDIKEHAALAFAGRVIETGGGVDAAEVQRVREAGFTDDQIAEIVGSVALNLFTNTFNRAFDVEIDFPLVEPRGCEAC